MTEILMPRLADGMEQGTILKWLVDDGAAIEAGDELVEIESDKATVTHEAESRRRRLDRHQRRGDGAGRRGHRAHRRRARRAAACARRASGGRDRRAGDGQRPAGSRRRSPAASRPSTPSRSRGSPAPDSVGGSPRPTCWQLPASSRTDLAPIVHTAPAPSVPSPIASHHQRRPHRAADAAAADRRDPHVRGQGDDPALPGPDRGRRRRRTRTSRASSRRSLPTAPRRRSTTSSCAPALSPYATTRSLNGSFVDGAYELHDHVHVGIAVAADDGLLVATLRDADIKSLGTLAAESRILADRVRAGQATPAERACPAFRRRAAAPPHRRPCARPARASRPCRGPRQATRPRRRVRSCRRSGRALRCPSTSSRACWKRGTGPCASGSAVISGMASSTRRPSAAITNAIWIAGRHAGSHT